MSHAYKTNLFAVSLKIKKIIKFFHIYFITRSHSLNTIFNMLVVAWSLMIASIFLAQQITLAVL